MAPVRVAVLDGVFGAMISSIDFAGSRPLRVLSFLHAADLGGVERAAMRLCAAWSRQADVTIALGRADGWDGDAAGCTVRLAPRAPMSVASFETGWMIWWLAKVIRRDRPDVLFCAGNSYTVVAVCMRLLLGHRCPPIVAKVSNSLHRPDLPWPVGELYRLWCRWQGRVIGRVVGMSDAMSREVRERMRLPSARSTTINSPVFDECRRDALLVVGRRPAECVSGARLFVAAGRLVRQKNFALMIRAFARGGVRDRDQLVILGEGPQRASLGRLIGRLGMASQIIMPGHQRDLTSWLSHADALLLSSDYEGVPAVVIEAMAAGRPVIATDCCASMAELIGSGRRGRLVPRGDIDAFARSIASFQPGHFDAEDARHFTARFTTERVARQYLSVFREAEEDPAPSPPFASGVLT